MSTAPPEQSPLAGRSVLLGVSGSIAAYKAADIASKLRHAGANVLVALTENATRFVGTPTFRALTGNPVLSGVFDEPYEHQIAHIHASQSVDLVLVAPATANVIAKMAHGIGDDILSTLLLATQAPVLIAPAMNSAMLAHPATQANLTILRARGVRIVDPGFGVLACRTEGYGKLADVQTIVDAVIETLTAPQTLAGRHVVITAGPTREPLDPVRFLTNRSSGRMGVALAEEARDRGARVTLVAGPLAIAPPPGCTLVRVETTDDMLAATRAAFADCDLLIAAAAPADFAPANRSQQKIKKSDAGAYKLDLRQTPDILATLAADKKSQVIVGFAAETEDLVANAREKLTRKRLDLVVANDVTAKGAGFDGDTNVATLVWPDGRADALPQMPKRELAARILSVVEPLLPRS